MKTYLHFKIAGSLAALVAATLSCTLGAAPTPTATPTETPPTAIPTEVANGLSGVRAATVQIIGEGAEFLGSGSGLIYSPDGLILTNNHVIEGATIIKVHIEGQADLLPAEVLGKSPCDDLAVLKINALSEYPSAKLGGEVAVGDPIYAVGYPLGDKVQSVTSGIISKTEANGATSFASIPRTLQTDAAVNPGNSGGPLITENGQVIGVVYASLTAAQGTNFAIPMDYALTIIKQLETGQNLHWLGLNTVALTAEAAEAYGVALEPGLFVLAVDGGSPAEKAGLQASDYLTAVDGQQVGADGTLKAYCDILRSHEPADVLSVAAIRAQARCNGQFNGKTLICQEVATSSGTVVSGDLTRITDFSGRMSTQAPAAWERGGDDGYIVTATSLDAWFVSYPLTQTGEATTTGFFLYQVGPALAQEFGFPAFTKMDEPYIRSLIAAGHMGGTPSNCEAVPDAENLSYDDGRYLGVYSVRTCGTEGIYIQVYLYSPDDPAYFIWYEAYAQSEAEITLVTSALTNFFIEK